MSIMVLLMMLQIGFYRWESIIMFVLFVVFCLMIFVILDILLMLRFENGLLRIRSLFFFNKVKRMFRCFFILLEYFVMGLFRVVVQGNSFWIRFLFVLIFFNFLRNLIKFFFFWYFGREGGFMLILIICLIFGLFQGFFLSRVIFLLFGF